MFTLLGHNPLQSLVNRNRQRVLSNENEFGGKSALYQTKNPRN